MDVDFHFILKKTFSQCFNAVPKTTCEQQTSVLNLHGSYKRLFQSLSGKVHRYPEGFSKAFVALISH